MSAKLDLFDALAAMFAEHIPEVKTFRLFNNQFNKEAFEKAFLYPAVFVEFSELQYSSKSEQLQEAETLVKLHIGFKSLDTEDRRIFELCDDIINPKMQGFGVPELASSFDRKRETQDYDHDGVIVWQIEYSTLVTDNSAIRRRKLVLVETPPAIDLEINVQPSPYFLKPQ